VAKPRREKKSPLKRAPLRNPGESLSAEIDRLIYEKAVLWIMAGVMTLVMAGYEWYRWAVKPPIWQGFQTVFALLVCGIAVWRVTKLRRAISDHALGLRGEKFVGQWLEQLRKEGYEVLHDIPGDGHNIDHVLVGPAGAFAVEAKTISKPAKGDAKVVFDGESITVNGESPDRDPIIQAKAAARELREIVSETCGRTLDVRGVVLYPGWYTVQPKNSAIWVLNETRFLGFIKHEKVTLGPDDVQLIAAGLRMHIRNASKT